MSKRMVKGYRLAVIGLLALLALACNPEASWNTDDVTITITPTTVSAGYIECSFATDKEAYYLVACEPVREDWLDPMDPKYHKQFMMLALDSANTEYIVWRSDLLKQGEFTIAPFASHCLQYGNIDHFFTNLTPGHDYWIYAFVVDPDKLKPEGKLFIKKLTTSTESKVDVHFDYRIRGYWDYIYPLNPDGKINNHFPYLAATRDSASLALSGQTLEEYFTDVFLTMSKSDLKENIHYGVSVVYNDGYSSEEAFEEGHTYYTAIVSFDGFIGNNVIYRFVWTGEEMEAYFTEKNSIVKE